jgi:6-phosphogluconolactonase/glucosamine-6-phosphate isomerase/deaminase
MLRISTYLNYGDMMTKQLREADFKNQDWWSSWDKIIYLFGDEYNWNNVDNQNNKNMYNDNLPKQKVTKFIYN